MNRRIFLLAGGVAIAILAGLIGYFVFKPELSNLVSTPLNQNVKHTTVPSNHATPIPPETKESTQLFIRAESGYYGGSGIISQMTGDEPSVTISGYNVTEPVVVSLYQADMQTILNYLVHDEKNDLLNDKVNMDELELIATTTETLALDDYGSNSKINLPMAEAGVYLVHAQSGSASQSAFIVRSSFGTMVRESGDDLIFWGQDTKTGRSITDGKVTIYDLEHKPSEIARAQFDREGIAKIPVTRAGDIGLVEYAGGYAVVPINLRFVNAGYAYEMFQKKPLVSRNFIFTDRPLYRPGDTIYFKSILRDDYDARYIPSTGMALVKIYRNYDEKQTVYEKNVPIVNGAISGEFTLPADASTGYYNLKVTTNASKNKMIETCWMCDSYYDIASFQVEFFRKPEYSIDVTVRETEYIAGDKVSFNVEGSYFSGQPIEGGVVKYQISRSDFYEYDYLSDQNFFIDDQYRYGYWGGSIVAEGKVELNDQGRAQVVFDAASLGNLDRSQVLSIETQFDNGSGNPAFARKNVVVYAGEFGIYRKDATYTSVVGQPVSIPVVLIPREGASSASVDAAALSIHIRREEWVKTQVLNQKYPGYTRIEENVKDAAVTVNKQGEASIDFTPEKTGSFTITVEGKDTRGNKLVKDFYIWIMGKDQPFYGGENENQLLIKADKSLYQPTDSARITISSEIPDRDVFISLERDSIRRYQIVRLKGNVGYVEVPLESGDIPNIFVKALSFSDRELNMQETDLKISKESKKMVVEVTPDRKTYGPGDTVRVNIETTDMGGNPVSGDVTVWAVDKAIFELAGEQNGDIFSRFWSDRYNGTVGASSLDGISSSGGAEMGCFAGDTPVLMSDGTYKAIESVAVGDMVLTREGIYQETKVPARVVAVEKTDVSGYLIINGSLKVTPVHRLWVNGAWKEAGDIQAGDKVIDVNNREVMVNSIEWQAGKFTVYNLEIEKYHTYFAGGIWVHNDKGGGGGRTVFKDTAYWNPTVKTDENGRAQVTFTIPDNLTTWVVAAVGATADTMVGQTKEEFVVTKDVIVRTILPNILREGDEVIVSALVQNFTDSEHVFDTALEFNSKEAEALQADAVTIPAKDMKQLYWRIKPEKGSEAGTLKFSATAQDNARIGDTVKQVLPIWAFGFYETRSEVGSEGKIYSIKRSPDADNSKTSITLSLAPTLLGTLPSAMKYLVDYPYGCVEQTTSRFVPAIIAKENQDIFGEAIADKDIDDIIKVGIKRLEVLQEQDGGWSWWSIGNSDSFITAYVLEYLVRAENLGFAVPASMFERAKAFLSGTVVYNRVDGTENTVTPSERIARTYALTVIGTLDKSETIQNFENLTPDILALAVLSNVKNGETDPQKNGLKQLLSLGKTEGESMYWEAGSKGFFGSKEASTALALRAIIAGGGDKAHATKAVRYLSRHRVREYWTNTFATAQVVQSVVEYTKTGEELKPEYAYSVVLDGTEIARGRVTDAKSEIPTITIPLSSVKQEGSKLEIIKSGDGEIYSVLRMHEFHTDRNAKPENHGLTIERKYISDRGGKSIEVGDTVQVEITVSGLPSEEYYAIIDDELPAGLIPVNTVFNNEQYGQDYRWYYYNGNREVTENGMRISLYYMKAGKQTYTYTARAVSAGTYIAPPTFASLMYAPEIYGRSGVDTVSIAEKGKGEVIKDNQEEGSVQNSPEKVNKQIEKQTDKGGTASLYQKVIAGVGALVLTVLMIGIYYQKSAKNRDGEIKKDDSPDSPEPPHTP